MPKNRYIAEEIIHELREASVLRGQGNTVGQVRKQTAVTDPAYSRWHKTTANHIWEVMKIDLEFRISELSSFEFPFSPVSFPESALYNSSSVVKIFSISVLAFASRREMVFTNID